MPALAASAQIAWPTATPPAVRMPLPRPPKSVFRIVRAVSWPGVTMTTAETPRNARTCVITAPSVAGRMLARDGSHLRCHRPARSALHTADRADAESRGPWLRIRLDVRLTHPLAGLLCNVAACRRGHGEDQARPLRYEPGHPRPDHHGQLVRDDAGHLERPDGDGHRPGRLVAPRRRVEAGAGGGVRGSPSDDQGPDERPEGRVERKGAPARMGPRRVAGHPDAGRRLRAACARRR